MGKPAQTAARQSLIARLTMYWKMEGANIAIVPIAMVLFAGGQVGPTSLIALVPMMALLAIGTLYWRAKLHQIERGISPDDMVSKLAQLDMPMAAGSIIAVLAAAGAWTVPGWAVGTADKWVATSAAILTVLEYINYYHRQLQHFDHLPDWKRLLSGRGFRKSQLRRDIERVRNYSA
ncbi:hypothetical protein [Erythrobacter sp. F6033]|uniref:hypothetical protein n=1 Tax=Erythrobacter sp. F6033 TaxID=2926401 RepID=UPI001FF683AA|nr:hypothetical protein [Erythrobacter sp. F6033]MCK0129504.1 hypothetical protein [Erythrobacter sp. F6033]